MSAPVQQRTSPKDTLDRLVHNRIKRLSRMRDKANDHIKLNGAPSVTAEREVEFAQIELQEIRHLAEVVDRMVRAMGAARAALTRFPNQDLVGRIDKVLLQMDQIP